jgi:hypothetical protein
MLIWDWNEETRSYLAELNTAICYQIHDSSQHVDYPTGKWAAIRNTDFMTDAKDGYLDHSAKVVCGSGIFCACGLPPSAEFIDLEDAKKICQQDADSFKDIK